ncbi:chemotaxis protein CheX [Litchfieldia alkalitelluris]|uniref:chemotaxis protein CheX n=1 Tax=Litchfieldia alkalitelluris TaxID=304268 RepID=UPI0009988AAB|nr:chemotaxis protein CheX [Litchfieldia alkalitelluris]
MTVHSIKEPSFQLLLKEVVDSINSVIPAQPIINHTPSIESAIPIDLGVSVHFTGDMKGLLFLKGEKDTFSSIAEMLYGMRLDGEMLTSFTGEVGNMIAGTLSTNLTKLSLKTDITSPELFQSDIFNVAHHEQALGVELTYDAHGVQLDVILMVVY